MPAHFLHAHFLPEQGGQPRVTSHGGARLNRSGLVMRVKMTRLIRDLGTVLAP